ncbi:MAG: efflux RND transporter permease subunit [Desulfobacterales bacterium]|jgi:multidrug efflux pump subunit AcrB|nr:efflux RND transporter permease subunit [Desulfobacterales bacterium]
MKPHRFALENPWLMLVCALLVAVMGIKAFFTLPVEYFPDTSPPQVAVVTVEPGAAAADMARRITEIIEKELSSLSGLKKVSSTSRDAVSAITAEFFYEKPIGEAVVDVQNAISRIRADLPNDILEPRIYRITDATRPTLTLALSPKPGSPLSLAQIRLLADNDIKDFILSLSEVADVDTFGGSRLQINVKLNKDRLRAYGLSAEKIVSAIQSQNITAPAGLIYRPDSELLIKTIGEFKNLNELENLVVCQKRDLYIRLSDVGIVTLGIQDPRSLYHGNGRAAIAVNVLRAEGGNTMAAIAAVKRALPQMMAQWPGIHFEITDDQAPLIERNTKGMRQSLFMAIGLTVLIIFIFLADLRASFISLISIPLSFLFGLAALSFTGYTLNVVTLSGLIIATGMVVDATVVVLENIHRHSGQSGGADTRPRVEGAVGEILPAITAGMLTTVAMLIPIMFAGGYVEKVLRQFTLTLSLALVGSLLSAVFIVPLIARKMVRPDRTPNWIERLARPFGRIVNSLADGYVRLLQTALKWRLAALFLVIAALILTARTVIPVIGRELMPPMDTGIAKVFFEMPPATSIEEMERRLSAVEAILKKTASVRMISSVVGSEPGEISFGGGGQTTQSVLITVTLVTRDQRSESIWEIGNQWRDHLSRMPGIRSFQVYEFGATPMSTSRAPIDIVLHGRDSRVLQHLAAQVEKRLEGVPGLLDMTRTWWPDKPEVNISVDSRTALRFGVTPAEVARQMQAAVDGIPASGFRLKGFLDIPIRVSLADAWVASPTLLSDIDIDTPKGKIPLRAIAAVSENRGQTVITREHLQNTLDLTGYNQTRRITQVLAEIDTRLADMKWPGGYDMTMSGTAAEMKDSMGRVMKAVGIGIIFLVVLLVGMFRSFLLPIPILVAIPLAIIGSLWGLLLYQKPMCMPAIMGLLLLAGIVINNSIFLIDFIRQARAEGMDRQSALEQSVRLRLRPVLMTTISTFVGMLPIIYETAVGLERMSPLGTAAGFGLLVGTVMTLVITPVVYSLLDDLAIFFRRLPYYTHGVAK